MSELFAGGQALLSDFVKIGFKVIFFLLALLGFLMAAVLAVIAITGTFQDEPIATATSPNGRYVAQTIFSDEMFDKQTLVVIERKDGRGGAQTVLTYDVPFDLTVDAKWMDNDTVAILTPCEPPTQISPSFYDDTGEELHRIVVEVAPRSPKCRYPRGTLPPGRQLENAMR